MQDAMISVDDSQLLAYLRQYLGPFQIYWRLAAGRDVLALGAAFF